MPNALQIGDTLAAETLFHPLRRRMLEIMLSKPPLSASALGKFMQTSAQRINYHMKKLEGVGLVECVDTIQRRGVVENFYQPVAEAFILADHLMRLPSHSLEEQRKSKSLKALRLVAAEFHYAAMELLDQSSQATRVSPAFAQEMKLELKSVAEQRAFIEDLHRWTRKIQQKYGPERKPDSGQAKTTETSTPGQSPTKSTKGTPGKTIRLILGALPKPQNARTDTYATEK